jgi:glycosyltransferase involved in cell wall biosynthesis
MRILFLDRSTRLQTVTDLERRARGGMVTSLFKVTDYLAEQGYDVTVVSDIQSAGRTRAGVKWLHEVWGEFDVLVTNRGTHDGYPDIKARKRILWTHDLPHSGFIPEPKTIHAFACTVFMSKYAERIWRTFYKDIGRSVIIPNGVDKKYFYPRQKDLGYLIYASAPNRGLDKLPLIFDAIKTRTGKPLRLRAFSNLASLHPNEVGTGDKFDYKAIEDSDVELCDPLPQAAFANELGQAGLMILPSGYPEICSNVVLQALACGTPVITTGNLGATPEWVRDGKNGALTQYQPHDYMVHTVEIVRNAVRVLEDECLHERLIKGASKTSVMSWTEIGAKWARLLGRYC